MKSDRIFGLVVILGALAYIAGALQIESGMQMDPLGPRAFPLVIAAAGLICGIGIMLRPDPEPDWPALPAWLAMAGALAVLLAYAFTVTPMGFLIPTAVASGVIGFLIRPRALPAAIMGATLAAVLFVIFKYGLGLGLQPLPRGWIG